VLPDLTVLIALLVGIGSLAGAPTSPGRALLGSGLCFLVGCALSRMAAARGLRAVDSGDLLGAEASGRWTTLWVFGAWIGALWGFDWGPWVNTMVPKTLWITRYLVLLAPLVGMLAVAWAARSEVEAELIFKRGGVPPVRRARAAIMAGFRRNGIVLLPLFIIIGVTDGIWLAGELGVESLRIASLWAEAMPLLQIGFMLALILITLPFLPRIIARMIKAEPLAPGALRDRLVAAAATVDLGYRDIMIWRTGGRVLNAMVVGFTKRSRMIFITDGLLDALTEDEVMAVFFHEAGHAKKQHLPLFMVAFFALSLLFYGLRIPMQRAGIPLPLQVMLHLGVLWFILLGWVSRRFERESDIYGAEHAAVLSPDAEDLPVPGISKPIARGAALMVMALQRIQTVAGYSGSHRHGSVGGRMAFVSHYAISPEVRESHRSGMRTLKTTILGALVFAVALTIWRMPEELAHAHAQVDLAGAQQTYDEATKLAHKKGGVPEAKQAELARLWQESYDGFVGSLERVGERDDPLSQLIRIQSTFAAGDIAIHGLRDPVLAKPHFAKVLELVESFDLAGPEMAIVRFECHIDLGRIAAWDYRALPVGDERRDRTAMKGHLSAARKLRDFEMGGLPAERSFKDDRFLAERARLLQATIDAAIGDEEVARPVLERLVTLRDTAKAKDYGRFEVAEDAALELKRLPPKQPQDPTQPTGG
jgi:Zn-dependent protease with chaperone function